MAAGICPPVASPLSASCCCHERSAVALASELLRHSCPFYLRSTTPYVRERSIVTPLPVSFFSERCAWKMPPISSFCGRLRQVCMTHGTLRMGTHRCGFLLASCATFLAILPLHLGSPVLLGSPAPFRSRPSCAEPPFQSSPIAKEDLVLQVTLSVRPPPVATFSGGRAWKMPTGMEALPLPYGLWYSALTDRKVHGKQRTSTLRQRKQGSSRPRAAYPGLLCPVPVPSSCLRASLRLHGNIIVIILSRILLFVVFGSLVLLTAGQVAVKLCLEKYGSCSWCWSIARGGWAVEVGPMRLPVVPPG